MQGRVCLLANRQLEEARNASKIDYLGWQIFTREPVFLKQRVELASLGNVIWPHFESVGAIREPSQIVKSFL
ncbi:hypothetical protein D3H34_29905 [Acidovorax cavernicola]|uniref:Uncharacterized protein n=1 Tax=Acidovorax cavernicola TaxID=1675792 RepID=A0A9X8CYU8_9BURK|nr:hypothetical protein D3H34_29905 [Acidovorax cavernicola]